MAEVTPVWEKSIPPRHGSPVFSLKLMILTWATTLRRSERTLRQIEGNSNAMPKGCLGGARAVSNRRRHLPATKGLLKLLNKRQPHVLSPRPGRHLDADRQAFRRGANPYRRGGPAGEVM